MNENGLQLYDFQVRAALTRLDRKLEYIIMKLDSLHEQATRQEQEAISIELMRERKQVQSWEA